MFIVGGLIRSELSESDLHRNENSSISRSGTGTLAINHREISNVVVNGDHIEFDVQDFSGRTRVGETYTVSYPMQRTFLRYSHDFDANVSHPVEELFTVVTDLEYSSRRGRIVANPEFVNEEKSFPHQKEINQEAGTNGYQMNDGDLSAKPFMRTFILTDFGKEFISETALQENNVIPYEQVPNSIRTVEIGDKESRDGDNDNYYQRVEISEDWKRPDGSIFTKKTEDVIKKAKPKPPAPVPAPAQHVVNQAAPGGVANEFERFGHFVGGGGDCTIM